MGAYQRAGATLDALVQLPFGHSHGNAALLELGRAGGDKAIHAKRAYGQLVTSCARMGSTIFSKYSVAFTFTGIAPVVAVAHSAGT